VARAQHFARMPGARRAPLLLLATSLHCRAADEHSTATTEDDAPSRHSSGHRRATCTCGNYSRCAAPHAVPLPVGREDIRAAATRWPEQARRVPKIVHQTWKACDGTPMPQAGWRESCVQMNPDWSFWLWTDEDNRNLIAEHYPSFLKTYDGYDHFMKRVDAARIFYLHRFGGVYMDMDFACLKPLDMLPMPPGEAWFSYQRRDISASTVFSQGGAVANNVMGGPPHHPFYAYAIEGLRAQASRPLLKSTGPDFLSGYLTHYADTITKPVNVSKMIVLHHLPKVYPMGWKAHRPNPCGAGRPAELERCSHDGGIANNSILVTFWTMTWKRPQH